MATLHIYTDRIIQNVNRIDSFLEKHNTGWTLITKVLSGHKEFLRQLLSQSAVNRIHSIGDSRISGLRVAKEINPSVKTMYIKPPAMDLIKSVVKWADISLNSSFRTIEALNAEAQAQNKIHQVIIMIEMGELREGVLREEVVRFYEKVFNFPHIEVVGLGTNLGCLHGIQPTYDKLLQLALYKIIIEKMFNTSLPVVSGGSSITLPLVGKPSMPKAINHLRIGEAAFLGTSPFDGKKFRNLSEQTFQFEASIIELEKKSTSPDGTLSDASVGHTGDLDVDGQDFRYRALVDFGLLDVDPVTIKPIDNQIQFAGITSDLTVYDLGKITPGQSCRYKVGDRLKFVPEYMAIARLMNSKFVDKILL